ncbi:hypothetical protein Tco_0551513 [Tanacetum coccineum]
MLKPNCKLGNYLPVSHVNKVLVEKAQSTLSSDYQKVTMDIYLPMATHLWQLLLFLFRRIHLRRVWVLIPASDSFCCYSALINLLLSRVIPAKFLFIPKVVQIVAPEVGAVYVTSPAGVLDLVDYSSSDFDPSEDSLPPAPELPLVSPFLCFDDSEADSESEPAEQKPKRHESLTIHDAMVSRWRDRVTSGPSLPSGSSSHDAFAPSFEFPLAPVLPHPGFVDGQRFLSDPIVGLFPARRLACRRVSHHSSDRHYSPDFASDSSYFGSSSNFSSDTSSGSPSDPLSDSSLVHSSGCDTSGQIHSGPSTRVASPRLVYPPIYLLRGHWIHLHLLLDYLARDADPLLLWFRDSYSPEASREEHMETSTADAEVVADLGIGDRVGAPTEDGIGMGVEVAANDIREDDEEFETEASAGGTMEIVVDPLVTGGIFKSTRGDVLDIEGTLYDITHYMYEVPLDRIAEFETTQRQLEAGQLMASEERANLTDRIRSLGRENLRIRRDRDDTRRRLGRLESLVERRLGFRSKMDKMVTTETVDEMETETVEEMETETVEEMETKKVEEMEMEITMRMIEVLGMLSRELMKLMAEVYCPRTEIQKMESEL